MIVAMTAVARRLSVLIIPLLLAQLWLSSAQAAGGLLGIDHEWHYDNSGIWKRSYQMDLEYALIGVTALGAAWEGGDTRLGRTLWQSIDASAAASMTALVLKKGFARQRPIDGNDPNGWFKSGNESFPSGEVTLVSAIVTPFVLEYSKDHPAVYALELLPVYDAIARMKVQAHWQTDVLAGFAIGTAWGYYAHGRDNPLILSVLPKGFEIGWKTKF